MDIQEPYQRFGFNIANFDLTSPHRISSLKIICLISIILGAFVGYCYFTIWLMNIHYLDMVTTNYESQNNDGKNPAIVWYTPAVGIPLNKIISCFNRSKDIRCDVFLPQSKPDNPEAYLFYAPFLVKFPLPRYSNVIWGLLHDESPINKMIYMHEKALNLFNFSATFSRYSDVPFPLMKFRGLEDLTSTRFFVDTPSKNFRLSEIAPVMYMQTNWVASTERDEFVKELMKYIRVDSYGARLRNKNLPLNQIYTDPLQHDWNIYRNYLYDAELLQFLARYKFIIAIENGVCNDYVTEKLWRALEVGVVPIYFGSPLIRDWLPNNKSAILLEDYPTPEKLSKYLYYLLQNDTAYDEYLDHKTLGLVSNKKLIDEITARPYQNNLGKIMEKFECFVCEKLHDKKNSVVNVMKKKDYDCPPPTSALNLSSRSDSLWQQWIDGLSSEVDNIYKEIWDPNNSPRVSNIAW